MFWKKSTDKDKGSSKLFKNPEEIRGSFRVHPSAEAPIEMILDNKPVSVLNISSGGLCCVNDGFEVGGIYLFHFILPGIDKKVTGKIEIREITEKNHCRCKFQNLLPEYQDLIHRYTLNRQKEDLEKNKKRSTT
ncbi:MAG: hypothetical protein NPINA01_30910 [Nitrospinaceae bacterium]|nr:MAG: hypothetical protein NPINA01_30910 [Nitrospinaceae bacterium]